MAPLRTKSLFVVLCLSTPAAAEDAKPPRPELSFIGRTFRNSDTLGHLTTADTHESALNQRHALYVFNPSDPLGAALRVFELPAERERERSQLVWHGGEVFYRLGTAIHRWKPGTKASKLWYQANRSFVSFQVVDEHTVLLAGTSPKGTDPRMFLLEPLDEEALKQEEVLLLESVDVKTGLRNARHPFPEGFRKLFACFEPFALYDLWLMRSGDTFLCLLPTLGHAYAYKPESARLRELETPWPWLDEATVRPHLSKVTGPKKGSLNPPAPFYLGLPSISPGMDRRLYITYRQHPVSARILERFWTNSRPPSREVAMLPGLARPALDLPGAEEPSPFRVAVWKEGNSGFEPVKCSGPVDVEKGTDLALSGRLDAFLMQGIFITRQEEPQGMDSMLEAMRKQAKIVKIPGPAAPAKAAPQPPAAMEPKPATQPTAPAQ